MTVADHPLNPAVDLPAFFEVAFQDFRRGRLDESEKSCREILRVDPDQADAWFLLGAPSP